MNFLFRSYYINNIVPLNNLVSLLHTIWFFQFVNFSGYLFPSQASKAFMYLSVVMCRNRVDISEMTELEGGMF